MEVQEKASRSEQRAAQRAKQRLHPNWTAVNEIEADAWDKYEEWLDAQPDDSPIHEMSTLEQVDAYGAAFEPVGKTD